VFDHVSPFLKITQESLQIFLERDDAKGGLNMQCCEVSDDNLTFHLSSGSDAN
jgi:hypothetical protein